MDLCCLADKRRIDNAGPCRFCLGMVVVRQNRRGPQPLVLRRVPNGIMRTVPAVCVAAAALLGGMVSAYAAAAFVPSSGLLTDHEKILKYQDQHPAQPYAMNFTDEAAQTLGVHNGRWGTTDPPRDGLVPNLSGGVDMGNPMVKLQWRLGQ